MLPIEARCCVTVVHWRAAGGVAVCGICGYIDGRRQTSADDLADVAGRMADTLAHRGPDDRGIWTDAQAGIALGHRRLAVLDLTSHGHQPMASRGGRYILNFNGEIYNFRSVRATLLSGGVDMRSQCDTEVLVESIARWGLKEALAKLNGMFAFGVWDRRERTLSLVRDRLGEKPLYYYAGPSSVIFASELSAFRAAQPLVRLTIDRDAVALLMRYKNIPAPRTIYQNVRKLLPGRILTISCSDGCGDPDEDVYWSGLSDVRPPEDLTDAEATEEIEALLRDSVRLRMESDVPLGAFLSGGMDSALVVATMVRESKAIIKTFSIGSSQPTFDETAKAEAVASHLGTDHTTLRVSDSEALDVVPHLSTIYGEPFADPSAILTYIVCRLARRDVTVSLSGDGGDELFGGYNRHRWIPLVWERSQIVPYRLRRSLGSALTRVPASAWIRLAGMIPERRRPFAPDLKGTKLGRIMAAASPWEMYRLMISQWQDPDALVVGGRERDIDLGHRLPAPGSADMSTLMMALDAMTYLPDDNLARVDRASMAVGLEARVPLLDHRIVERALALPLSMKIRGRTTKWVLRQILEKYVPGVSLDGPKRGFGAPVAHWLRGSLRPWAEDLLEPGRIRQEGYLDPVPIASAWGQHLAGTRDRSDELWCVLMFQQWLEAD